jgi:hypothetical protein
MTSPKPSQTTQTTEVKLPDWVEKAGQGAWEAAKRIAETPYQAYKGAGVAAASDMTKAGYDYLMKNVGASDPLYEEAANRYQSTFAPLDISPYMNTYTDEVEGRAVSNATRSLAQQQQGLSDAARKAKAFGGSRQQVASGVLGAEGARGIGDLSAELRRQGYDKATETALAEKAGTRQSAEGLRGVGTTRQASMLADVGALGAAGADDERRNQKMIDYDIGQFNEARGWGTEQLNKLLATLGMIPYGKTENSTRTGTSEQGGTDWASTILGGAKLLGGFMGLSDVRDKTDITELGETNEYGFPLYSYRYKGDPKSYPKVVGPMAQDIEERMPGVVKEVGGHKTVPLGLLSNGL